MIEKQTQEDDSMKVWLHAVEKNFSEPKVEEATVHAGFFRTAILGWCTKNEVAVSDASVQNLANVFSRYVINQKMHEFDALEKEAASL